MLQSIKKRAFKNTLWFLLPSGVISLIFIVLGFIDLLVTHSVSALSSVPSFVYYFFLIHNIPFFIASIALFTFLQKGYSKTVSILGSNSVAILSWFLTFGLSAYIFKMSDYSIGGLLIFAIAILAEIIFFFRSIHISFENKTTTIAQTNASSSPSRARRIPLFGIAVIVSIVVIFILITSGIL